MLTLMPANFVPGEAAAAAEADAAGEAATEAAGLATAGADALGADGVGVADELQALKTRIGTIAAAIDRYRDTTLALLLTDVTLSNILNTRR
jgi:hypothetical protein